MRPDEIRMNHPELVGWSPPAGRNAAYLHWEDTVKIERDLHPVRIKGLRSWLPPVTADLNDPSQGSRNAPDIIIPDVYTETSDMSRVARYALPRNPLPMSYPALAPEQIPIPTQRPAHIGGVSAIPVPRTAPWWVKAYGGPDG